MFTWLYVWSPKYEIFHYLLQNQTKDISGFQIQPVFFPQSVFARKEGDDGKHFLTGIGVKIYVLLKNLESKEGEYVVFSDVDILCLKQNLASILEEYKKNDITCMRESLDSDYYNIGFMLVKNTPNTINLFKRVLERIRTENMLDQDVFNEELKQFNGSIGHFSIPEFIQSNMIEQLNKDENYAIIQCLSSDMNPERMMVEKLATATYFFDITPLRKYISDELENGLKQYFIDSDVGNYVLKWPTRISSSNKLT